MKVTQLDSNVEEVTLQEIQLRKAFRSSQTFDQQVVSRETMPKSMQEQYMACDKPPPLDKLNPYREVRSGNQSMGALDKCKNFRMAKMDSNSTLIQITSLNCGDLR